MYKVNVMYWNKEEVGTIEVASLQSAKYIYEAICNEAVHADNNIMQVGIYDVKADKCIEGCSF